MLHLRVISPPALTDAAVAVLAGRSSCTNLVVLPGAGQRPQGDLVLADVAREGADAVLRDLQGLGLAERGSIAVESVDLSLSAAAERAQAQAPGHGSDAVVWEDLVARTREESALSGAYLVLFAVATALAGVAVLTDSAILVIGAMIVGPEYGALAAICAGVVLRRGAAVRRAAAALAVGFPVGVVATVLSTWGLDALGLVSAAVALAYAVSADAAATRPELLGQAWTSVEQLLLNLLGILLAGTLTLWAQQRLWRRWGGRPARARRRPGSGASRR
ncbi:hypothetical protein [Quadrisphaera sp. DSM 44207]|uniref:hypothetical protein n=1 Tax=Quadrisphaera sp. DSM 44207 TaxID=1881057 RepID=UPI00088166EF|nr:hypothetical protein [Quadrisphaera sp. DSM 44207]SDQ85365.1 hypothetical protein SAMN05428996_2901 [Quadrisphaera sp. DSM 44207]